jgi:hypothetical protein
MCVVRDLLLTVSMFVAATNLSGMWTLELNPDFGGVDDKVDCTFKQEAAKLSVDCGGAPISGEIDGKAVTLRVTTGRNNEYTATMTGRLDNAETTISGRWELTDDAGEREGKFTARKH